MYKAVRVFPNVYIYLEKERKRELDKGTGRKRCALMLTAKR